MAINVQQHFYINSRFKKNAIKLVDKGINPNINLRVAEKKPNRIFVKEKKDQEKTK